MGSTHYIAASGSDSNNGTSISTPWQHAPGMSGCSGNCSSYHPSAGDSFILRGGDTWHNVASGRAPSGIPWSWSWGGANGNSIYVGVDQTWYNPATCGTSWCRPILNGDNPLSTSAVSSCAYQVGSTNQIVSVGSVSYVTFDNLEVLGLCQNSMNAPWAHDVYFSEGNTSGNVYENIYAHGWTHIPFSCSVSGGEPVGSCYNMNVFQSAGGNTTTLANVVIDGSDSDPAGAAALYNVIWDIHDSVFRYESNVLGNGCHALHDNLFEYIVEPGDGVAHGNTYECISEDSGPNVIYNNLVRHIGSSGGGIGVNFWPLPPSAVHDYWFNNVMYDVHAGGNYFDIQTTSNNTPYLFNNTFENPDNGPIVECNSGNPVYLINNHYITDSSSPYKTGTCNTTPTTDLRMSHSTATSQGYTSTNQYSPISNTDSTVAAGTNSYASLCNAMLASQDPTVHAAGAACQSDTSWACTYNVNTHTVTCPARISNPRPSNGAWDIGAYEYAVQDPPSPPTSLTATPY